MKQIEESVVPYLQQMYDTNLQASELWDLTASRKGKGRRRGEDADPFWRDNALFPTLEYGTYSELTSALQ